MLKSISIEGFRGLARLTVDRLARINLIAGMNNTGKTALLEAIHVSGFAGNCAIPVALNNLRGLGGASVDPWNAGKWLFYNQENSRPIRLQTTDDENLVQTLTINFIDAQTANTPPFAAASKKFTTQFTAVSWDATSPRLILDYSDSRGNSETSVGVVTGPEGILFTGSTVGRPTIFVGSKGQISGTSVNHYVDDQNELFSELDASGKQGEILPVLLQLEPRLKKLMLLTFGKPMIYAQIGLSRPVPLALMGEGFARVLFFLLLITMRPKGIVLIDEIENGLHHSVMKDVWKAIAQAARQADVQVFATTHSYECIQAAHEGFSESDTYDLRLLRLDRLDGEITVAAFDQEVLEYSLDMSHEVR